MNFSNLMTSKFFAPLFWTQFLGAFNDNVYKNALILLITYKAAAYTSLSADLLIPLCGGIFILPFFLFSALAGQLADKYEKSLLIRYVKFAEINIMILAAIGFYFENIWFLLTVLFLMGCQSSLFGPVKYSILPQHLNEEGLLKGNGLIEMGTFLAILLGTLVGGILIMLEGYGSLYISILVISIALAGWLSSQKIPLAESANQFLHINWNILSETWKILSAATKTRLIFGAILGISWFWFIGATILAILPGFTKNILYGNEQVVTLLLALFSIGIGIGSMIAGKSKTLRKSIKWVIIGSLGITIIGLDLYWVSAQLVEQQQHVQNQGIQTLSVLLGWQEMFKNPLTLHILISVLLLGSLGGFYIVPLYVILQEHSAIKTRSRTIAANNISNALFMVGSAIITMMLLDKGVSLYVLYALLGIVNLFMLAFLFWRFSGDVRQVLG